MWSALKKFIATVQNSEEAVRRRWLILLSGVSMLAVIGLWVFYFNLIVKPVEPEKPVAETARPGFAQIFGAGFKVVLSQLKDTTSGTMKFLKEKLGAAKIITFDKSGRNFIVEDLEKIHKTPLP